MADVNEAYRVLRDPSLRSRYDTDLRLRLGRASNSATASQPSTFSPNRSEEPHGLQDPTPARYPWKLVGGMAAVGAAVVLVGAALYEPAGPKTPDNVLQPGSCVAVELNNDVREVTCDGFDDLVVRHLIPMDATCSQGLSAYRDRQGMGVACVSNEPD